MPPITIETTSTLETILTFVGPLVGVGIGLWGSNRVAKATDRRSERVEITRALANYMAAAELVAVELGSFPEDSWFERKIDHYVPQSRRIGSFVERVMLRIAFGTRLDELRRGYQQARAELVLVAPIRIIGIVSQVDDLFIEWQTTRSDEMKRKWMDRSNGLRLEAQATVDEGRCRPYRAGEAPINGRQVGRRERVADFLYRRISGHEGSPAGR